jgi:hypothetical protein
MDVTKVSKDIQEQSQNDFALEVSEEQLEVYVDILLHETSFLFDDKVKLFLNEINLIRSINKSKKATSQNNCC